VRLLVGRLTRRLRQESAGGLTPSQLSVVASVDRLGPIQLGDLARVEAVAPPTLTRAVDRLEEQGIVRRRPDPVDGRAVLVEITPSGRAALEDVRSARSAFLAKGLAALTEDERLVVSDAIRLLNQLLTES
jgi:DNA-binding MarR family transcriptional regulator